MRLIRCWRAAKITGLSALSLLLLIMIKLYKQQPGPFSADPGTDFLPYSPLFSLLQLFLARGTVPCGMIVIWYIYIAAADSDNQETITSSLTALGTWRHQGVWPSTRNKHTAMNCILEEQDTCFWCFFAFPTYTVKTFAKQWNVDTYPNCKNETQI